jgi:hypothetical protein
MMECCPTDHAPDHFHDAFMACLEQWFESKVEHLMDPSDRVTYPCEAVSPLSQERIQADLEARGLESVEFHPTTLLLSFHVPLSPSSMPIRWRVGDVIEAFDRSMGLPSWKPAVVLSVGQHAHIALVHYQGWSRVYDEVFWNNSPHVRPLTTKTHCERDLLPAQVMWFNDRLWLNMPRHFSSFGRQPELTEVVGGAWFDWIESGTIRSPILIISVHGDRCITASAYCIQEHTISHVLQQARLRGSCYPFPPPPLEHDLFTMTSNRHPYEAYEAARTALMHPGGSESPRGSLIFGFPFGPNALTLR